MAVDAVVLEVPVAAAAALFAARTRPRLNGLGSAAAPYWSLRDPASRWTFHSQSRYAM